MVVVVAGVDLPASTLRSGSGCSLLTMMCFSVDQSFTAVARCFTSTDTITTVTDEESMTAASTFTQLLASVQSLVSMVPNIHRHHKACLGRGEWGRGLYTYHYTFTIRMTPALRWVAMRSVLMFH